MLGFDYKEKKSPRSKNTNGKEMLVNVKSKIMKYLVQTLFEIEFNEMFYFFI